MAQRRPTRRHRSSGFGYDSSGSDDSSYYDTDDAPGTDANDHCDSADSGDSGCDSGGD